MGVLLAAADNEITDNFTGGGVDDKLVLGSPQAVDSWLGSEQELFPVVLAGGDLSFVLDPATNVQEIHGDFVYTRVESCFRTKCYLTRIILTRCQCRSVSRTIGVSGGCVAREKFAESSSTDNLMFKSSSSSRSRRSMTAHPAPRSPTLQRYGFQWRASRSTGPKTSSDSASLG